MPFGAHPAGMEPRMTSRAPQERSAIGFVVGRRSHKLQLRTVFVFIVAPFRASCLARDEPSTWLAQVQLRWTRVARFAGCAGCSCPLLLERHFHTEGRLVA